MLVFFVVVLNYIFIITMPITCEYLPEDCWFPPYTFACVAEMLCSAVIR